MKTQRPEHISEFLWPRCFPAQGSLLFLRPLPLPGIVYFLCLAAHTAPSSADTFFHFSITFFPSRLFWLPPCTGEGVKFMVIAPENVSHLPLTSPLSTDAQLPADWCMRSTWQIPFLTDLNHFMSLDGPAPNPYIHGKIKLLPRSCAPRLFRCLSPDSASLTSLPDFGSLSFILSITLRGTAAYAAPLSLQCVDLSTTAPVQSRVSSWF